MDEASAYEYEATDSDAAVCCFFSPTHLDLAFSNCMSFEFELHSHSHLQLAKEKEARCPLSAVRCRIYQHTIDIDHGCYMLYKQNTASEKNGVSGHCHWIMDCI